VFMLKGRLQFVEVGARNESNTAPFPSALVVWGADRGEVEGLRGVFSDSWHVPRVL